jgi:hypothetical protein
MPTILTNPEVRVAVVTVTLDDWSLRIDRTANLSVDQAKTILVAKVTNRDAQGKELDTKTVRSDVAGLPAGLRTQIGNLHSALVTFLKAKGAIPAGTDTPDI